MDRRRPHVFISHASEDKDAIARPLAVALQRRGLSVWYDEFSLRLGDSLRRSIEKGLMSSRFGIVILSESFFAKEWPKRELDILAAREIGGKQNLILPVWHGVRYADILHHSPTLADRFAISTSVGIEAVADAVATTVVSRRRKRVSEIPKRPAEIRGNFSRSSRLLMGDVSPERFSIYLMQATEGRLFVEPTSIRRLVDYQRRSRTFSYAPNALMLVLSLMISASTRGMANQLVVSLGRDVLNGLVGEVMASYMMQAVGLVAEDSDRENFTRFLKELISRMPYEEDLS